MREYFWRHRAVISFFQGAFLAALLTLFLGWPLYRFWISANFLTFVMPARLRIIQLFNEFIVSWALWSVILYWCGSAGAKIYAFFLFFEFAPAVLCRSPSGLYEYACLCLFPASWTLLAWQLSQQFTGVKRLLSVFLAALLTAGVVQYVIYFVYIIRYGRRLGSNTLMTILGTNFIEAKSFLLDQFGLLPTAASLGLFLLLATFLRLLIHHCRTVKYPLCGALTLCLCVAVALFCRTKAPSYSNLFFDFQKGYLHYQTALDSLKKAHSDPQRRIEDLKISRTGHDEVCVVVIGESASPRHMQRWGYRRPTTPWLCSCDTKIQDALIVLERAYSCMVHTESAVTLALSQFSNYDPRVLLHLDHRDSSFMFAGIMKAFSLLEILTGAGVKTHWFSNQEKIGAYNNLVSALSRNADEQEFIEDLPLIDRKNGHQDEELLPLLCRTLRNAQDGESHAIFLHLRGSHWSYRNSAPENWPWLRRVKGNKLLSRKLRERIDAYDRSLTYTDDLLRQISEILAQSKFAVSSMVYFSDHGEDVTGVGHNFDAFKPVMAEIPVVLWLSPEYRRRYAATVAQLRVNSGRIFTSDLICPLVLGLMHVRCANNVLERQLTSEKYAVNEQNARFWQGRLLKSVIPNLERSSSFEGGKSGSYVVQPAF